MIIICLYDHPEEKKLIKEWSETLKDYKLLFHKGTSGHRIVDYPSIRKGENTIIAVLSPKTWYSWKPVQRRKKKYLKNIPSSIIKIKEIKEILKWKDSYKNYKRSILDSAYVKLKPF